VKNYLGIFLFVLLITMGFILENESWIMKTVIFIIVAAPVLFFFFIRVLEDYENRIKSLENRIYDLENRK
jgi:hypothetical protein